MGTRERLELVPIALDAEGLQSFDGCEGYVYEQAGSKVIVSLYIPGTEGFEVAEAWIPLRTFHECGWPSVGIGQRFKFRELEQEDGSFAFEPVCELYAPMSDRDISRGRKWARKLAKFFNS